MTTHMVDPIAYESRVEDPDTSSSQFTLAGSGSVPWHRQPWSTFVGPGAAAVGAIMLIVGYVGVASRDVDSLQIPYLVSGGLGGLFVLLLGLGFVAVRELRIVNDRNADLDRKVSLIGEALEDVLDELARQRS